MISIRCYPDLLTPKLKGEPKTFGLVTSRCALNHGTWMDAAGSMQQERIKDLLDEMHISMQLEELTELLASSI